MTPLDEIKSRLKRATPGPWHLKYQLTKDNRTRNTICAGSVGTTNKVVSLAVNYDLCKHNAEFISHAREDIERLVACVDVMREGFHDLRCLPKMDIAKYFYDKSNEILAEADKILGGGE